MRNEKYDMITLPNGLRVVGEYLPHVRSVSVGLWVGSGSQFEGPGEAGVSHFIEHMVFKGSARRTAREIAEQMDAVGGQMNAFTAKECTCFYAKVVDEHLPLAMDVIADMIVHPLFDEEDLRREKGVVIEEIGMSEDTPEDLVFELLMSAHYGTQSVALPILGTEESVSAFTRETVVSYWQRLYRPQNAVLALAGHYDWDEVLRMAEALYGDWSAEGFEKRECVTAPHTPDLVTREKDTEQIHICLGYPGCRIGDAHVFEESVFCAVYGGAMSSRLFQRVREEAGAAYSVYSSSNSYMDTGMLSVYAATSPENAEQVLALIEEETRKLIDEGMTEKEFTMAREQLRSSYVLGLESTSARMHSNGRRLLLLDRTRNEDEVLARISALKREDCNALLREVLSQPHSTALVGCDAERVAELLLQ